MSICEQVGTVGNEDTWRVVWEGSNGVPIDPDEIEGVAMTWEFRARGSATPVVVPLSLANKVATGTFEATYTPAAAGAYVVKAKCVINGADEATPETSRQVVR